MNAQNTSAQSISTVDEALKIGLSNNGKVKAAKTNVELQEQGKKAAFDLGKTDVGIQYGQYNSFENDLAFDINQNFAFPTVYTNQRRLANEKIAGSQFQVSISENQLKFDIRKTWYQLAYFTEKQKLLLFQDTIYTKFLNAANRRYETEASSYLEKVSVII